MSKLLLCALLAMPPLAQADSVMNRYDASEDAGGISTPSDGVMIAQVAAETAQLLPSSRRGTTPSSKVTRAVKPRAMTRYPKTRAETAYQSTSPKRNVVNGRRLPPSQLSTRYRYAAETT